MNAFSGAGVQTDAICFYQCRDANLADMIESVYSLTQVPRLELFYFQMTLLTLTMMAFFTILQPLADLVQQVILNL